MYQVVWLNAQDRARISSLTSALEGGMRDLGLEPGAFLHCSESLSGIEWRNPVVGVSFGGEASAEGEKALDRLLEGACVVFPVVDSLPEHRHLVPEALHPVNAFEWRSDPGRLAAELLGALGLTREQRSAFVSYRRSDSRAVAVQLFHCLSDHGYRTFLDTASIDFGVRFQETLWDRMADADLLVFVDTPAALSSKWVERELARANNLGLGVLQVVWPRWRPFAGTELSTRFLLADDDFATTAGAVGTRPPSWRPGPEDRLVAAALAALADAAERVRLRSLGSRRARLVGEIFEAARPRGWRATADPGGLVLLRSGSESPGKALPVVGLPTAEVIFGASSSLDPGGPGVRLVYDGYGMKPERRAFLEWLDAAIPDYRCLAVEALDDWLREIA